jgi:hypothetical protein
MGVAIAPFTAAATPQTKETWAELADARSALDHGWPPIFAHARGALAG